MEEISTTEDDSMVEASSPHSPSSANSNSGLTSFENQEQEQQETLNSSSSSPNNKNKNNNRNSTSLPLLHISSTNSPLNLIYSCGKNKYGILGQLDDYSEKSIPTTTPISKNSSHHTVENPSFAPIMIKHVEAGAYHLAILTEFGEVYLSGYNSFKEAMKTNQSGLSQLQKLHFDKKVKAISSGWFHLMLLTNEGDLYSSGLNTNGQLGLGDLEKRDDFEKVNIPKYKVNTPNSEEEECSSNGSGSSNEDAVVEHSIEDGKEEIIDSYELNIPIKRLCCGEHHSAFITNNGALYVAGKNNCGELGIGRKTSKPNVPYFTLVQAGFLAQDISFGKDHSVLLSQDGQIYVSGSNESGQIGLGNVKSVKKFVKINMVRPGFKITKISCGFVHSMAITNTGGYMICSGGNINGELGLSDRVKKPQFAMLKTNLIPKHVSCGASLSVFLTDQNAYSCGINTDGRLGTGETGQYSSVFKKVSSINTDTINRVETAAFSSHFYFSHRKAIIDSLPQLHFPIRHYKRDRIHDKIYGYGPLLRKVTPKFYENVVINEGYLNSMDSIGLNFAQYLVDCIQGHFVHKKEKIVDHLVSMTPIEKVYALYVMNHVDTDLIIENFRRFVMNYLVEEIDGNEEQTNLVSDELRMLLDNFKDINENIQDTPLEKVSRVVHQKKPFSHYINHPIHEQSNHKHIFHNMFNDQATSDVKVIIDSEKKHVLYLHKTLLSSYSPLFEKIFDEEFQFSKDDNCLDLFYFDLENRNSIEASEAKIKEKALLHLLNACYGISKQQDAEDDSFVLLNSEITILIGMIYHASLFQMDSVIHTNLIRKLATLLSVENFLDICKWMLMFGDETLFQQQRIPSSSPIFEPEMIPPIHEIFNLLTQFAEMNLKQLSKMYEGKLTEWDSIPHIKQLLSRKSPSKPVKKSHKNCSIQ